VRKEGKTVDGKFPPRCSRLFLLFRIRLFPLMPEPVSRLVLFDCSDGASGRLIFLLLEGRENCEILLIMHHYVLYPSI